MNQQGAVFTLIIMIMGLSIFGLYTITKDASIQSAKQAAQVQPLIRIADKETNLLSVVDGTVHGVAEEVYQRVLPFTFTLGTNSAVFTQDIPVEDLDVNIYFDTLNLYRIFATDTNADRAFDGISVDINTVLGPGWGNVTRTMNFNLLPQCLRYRIRDSNVFWGGGSCSTDFNILNLSRVDITFIPQEVGEDLNMFTCSIDGNSTCPDFDVNLMNPFPYFTLTVNDANCSDCSFVSNMVRGHFDPDAANLITISCIEAPGGSCESDPAELQLANTSRFSRASLLAATVQVQFTFRDTVKRLVIEDLNYSLRRTEYNLLKEGIR